MNKKLLLLVLLPLVSCHNTVRKELNLINNSVQINRFQLDDSFNNELASFWKAGNFGSGRYAVGSVVITKNCFISDQSCAQLSLNQGDIEGDGGDGHLTERTELDSGKYPFLNSHVEYSYSIFIPKDFPIVDTRLVISQLKQKGLHEGPIFAQRFRNGIHYATIRNFENDISKQMKFALPNLTKEKWHHFKIIIDYSNTRNGSIEFFMNENQYINFHGQTAYQLGKNSFYHKVGLYRDKIEATMTLLLDNYKLKF